MNGKYMMPSTLATWSIAVFGDERECPMDKIADFVDSLKQCFAKMGMPCFFPSDLKKLVVYQKRRGDFKSTLIEARESALAVGLESRRQNINKPGIDLVLCVIINRSDGL
jgi:hypothetical protein